MARRLLASRAALVSVALLGQSVLGLDAESSLAASLCPATGAHACYPFEARMEGMRQEIGFSTAAPPCTTYPGGSQIRRVFISSSATDPHVHYGPIADASLYLWARSTASSAGYGFRFAQTWLLGDIAVTDFEPSPGVFLHSFEAEPVQQVGWSACPDDGEFLVGRLVLEQPVAVHSGTWGRLKSLYR